MEIQAKIGGCNSKTIIGGDEITLTKVYNGVTLLSDNGEEFNICMRDSGFEFNYTDKAYTKGEKIHWFEAKDGKINPLSETSRRSDIPNELKQQEDETKTQLERLFDHIDLLKKDCKEKNQLILYYSEQTSELNQQLILKNKNIQELEQMQYYFKKELTYYQDKYNPIIDWNKIKDRALRYQTRTNLLKNLEFKFSEVTNSWSYKKLYFLGDSCVKICNDKTWMIIMQDFIKAFIKEEKPSPTKEELLKTMGPLTDKRVIYHYKPLKPEKVGYNVGQIGPFLKWDF